MQVRWVVQTNLGDADHAQRIEAECTRLGQPCALLKIIPFSETLPHIETDLPAIFYGGTGWVSAISKSKIWRPGVWFDDHKFRFSTALDQYGDFMLNYGALVLPLGALLKPGKGLMSHGELFIRPDRDVKEFPGDVVYTGDLEAWANRVSFGAGLSENMQVVVAKPVGISAEWRCFMVNGKVSSMSRYRTHRRFDSNSDAPERVRQFAEKMASVWSPAIVFVLDIGESNGELYVIETNCFNSAGFYCADIEKVVRDVSAACFGQTVLLGV